MPCAFHMVNNTSVFSHLPVDCQFDLSEDDLLTVDGIGWCIYHCPMTDEKEKPTEKANWEKKKLKNFNDQIDQWREDLAF